MSTNVRGLGLRHALFVAAFSIGVPMAAKAQQQASAQDADNNGQDFTALQNLFQLRYQYQTAPGSGAAKGSIRTVTTDTVYLRSDLSFDLPSVPTSSWKVVFRGDLPISAKDPITSDNPDGNYVYGLGDAFAQAALIGQLNPRWAVGAGLRITAPTGAEDITSGKWQAMPIIGARYNLPEVSDGSAFTGIVRYAASFAGDPTAKDISNLQLEPMLNIVLPDRWFFTFYPSADIRVNYGDPVTGQTGRLFLPADVMLGRNLSRNVALSLEVGVPIVRDYPVYDFKTIARFNMKF
jgi:hypothetical protein